MCERGRGWARRIIEWHLLPLSTWVGCTSVAGRHSVTDLSRYEEETGEPAELGEKHLRRRPHACMHRDGVCDCEGLRKGIAQLLKLAG